MNAELADQDYPLRQSDSAASATVSGEKVKREDFAYAPPGSKRSPVPGTAMSEQDYATVSGKRVYRQDFAYAPPGTGPSEWKLPIHDAAHVRNALARYNQTDLPASAKEGVWGKVVAAAKKFGIEVNKKSTLAPYQSGTGLARTVVLLFDALREVPVAIAGTWVKNGKKFSITRQDLEAMARNFEKRKNEQVVIDFEHASEMPEVARGGPVPAAGWIHALRLNGNLTAMVEWTPKAAEMIRSGEYRFFSPAIDFGATDKETGEAQGATLTSGALTNHPFLEELPPIMLSEWFQEMPGAHLPAAPERQRGEDGFMNARPGVAVPQGGKKMKYSIVKKLAGRRSIVGDDGAELGDFSLDDLALDDAEMDDLLAKRNPGAVPLRQSDSAASKMAELPAQIELLQHAKRALAFSECLSDGRIDLDKAAEGADQGKLGIKDFRQIQKAQELVEKSIQEGKFAPADREFISQVALADVGRFEEWAKKKPKIVPVGPPQGVTAPAEGGTPDRELALRLAHLMSEKSLDRKTALEQLAKDDPELVRRYRAGQGRVQ